MTQPVPPSPTYTMADITGALVDAGVNVRQEYWSGLDEDRHVYVLVDGELRAIEAIALTPTGDIVVRAAPRVVTP